MMNIIDINEEYDVDIPHPITVDQPMPYWIKMPKMVKEYTVHMIEHPLITERLEVEMHDSGPLEHSNEYGIEQRERLICYVSEQVVEVVE